jgi:hypothetical protein
MAELTCSNAGIAPLRKTEASARCDIGHVWRALRRTTIALLLVAFALLTFPPGKVEASDVEFVGTVGYTYAGSLAVLTANEVANFTTSGISGTLRLELWAFPTAYTGAAQTGYKLAEYSLGQLLAGFMLSNISSGPVAFASPPNGTWIFTIFVSEYAAGPLDDGYVPRDYRNFSTPVVIGPPPPPPPPPPPAITPQVGLWWNPNESGSGYALDYKHGVLVVTIYSYTTTGAPQWYLASGPLSGSTFTSTLDKYVSGQCIACSYFGRPAAVGNDGAITIVFSSATSATVYLPGGRVTQIQPQAF